MAVPVAPRLSLYFRRYPMPKSTCLMAKSTSRGAASEAGARPTDRAEIAALVARTPGLLSSPLPMSRINYFNTLSMANKLDQLARCRFMGRHEFADGIKAITGKKIVIVGCGAQGLNQGLNMRDSGCDVSYTLRQSAIDAKRASFVNATTNGFKVGTYEELIPVRSQRSSTCAVARFRAANYRARRTASATFLLSASVSHHAGGICSQDADLVLNLTPDKQHTSVVNAVMPMMKQGATLAYSHGFNIVEEGMQVRPDLTVIMVAPKCPGTEVGSSRLSSSSLRCVVARGISQKNTCPPWHGLPTATGEFTAPHLAQVREEYKRGFGVPTLIAVHPENDPQGHGLDQATRRRFSPTTSSPSPPPPTQADVACICTCSGPCVSLCLPS